MCPMLKSLLSTISVLIAGACVVNTCITPIEYRRKHRLRLPNGSCRTVGFRCRQFKHTVNYERWFMPSRTYYTYSVEMVSVDDMKYHDYHIGFYPHMAVFSCLNSTAPHWKAVNAHIDAITAHNSA